MRIDKFVNQYRIVDPDKFRLADFDPADRSALGLNKKSECEQLGRDIERLAKLQERLYAPDRWALLVIFQAMDAAGKDSAIEHVMSGVNPQGCHVYSFKAPTSHELDHDYMWRPTTA